MNLKNIISISPIVLENILYEEIKKIPGISEENIQQVKANDKTSSIDVYIIPYSLLANLYSLACDIQQAINFYLVNQFDIKAGLISINVIIVNPDKGEEK